MRIVEGLADSYQDSYTLVTYYGVPMTLSVRATDTVAPYRQLEGSWGMSKPTEMKVGMGLYPPLTSEHVKYARRNRYIDSYSILTHVASNLCFRKYRPPSPHGGYLDPYDALSSARLEELDGFRDWMTGYLGKYPGAVDVTVLDDLAGLGMGASTDLSPENRQWLKLSRNDRFYFYNSSPGWFASTYKPQGYLAMELRFEPLKDINLYGIFDGELNDDAVEYLKKKTRTKRGE